MDLCSIIIPTFNTLEYTKLCYESIIKYTNPPFEVIFVDNGSTDGTEAFFNKLPTGVTVLRNQSNQGFAKGCNQGAGLAKGNSLLFLNSDTVVTANWLDNLLCCLNSGPKTGAVSPCSNYVTPAQRIFVSYNSLDAMQEFARHFNSSDPRRWRESETASGFCLLLKKPIFEETTGFDEQFGIGLYEDTDLTFRVHQAGYKVIIAGDTFIHHFGNQTFLANHLKMEEYGERNQEKFLRKHRIIK